VIYDVLGARLMNNWTCDAVAVLPEIAADAVASDCGPLLFSPTATNTDLLFGGIFRKYNSYYTPDTETIFSAALSQSPVV
jgi:hypothetical protein